MADAIEPVEVASRHLSQWGVSFNEYDYANPVEGGSPSIYENLDLETLTIKVSNRRANVIESQVEPMAVRMDKRNTELDWLGAALSDLAAFSAQYTTKEDGTMITKATSTISETGAKGLALVGVNSVVVGSNTLNKADVDKWTQLVKTATDSRNNDSSMDMTRLESLVSKRDEAYQSASSLSDKIGGTRSTTIGNMV